MTLSSAWAAVPPWMPVMAVLVLVLVLFAMDRFRYEAVALSALVVLVLIGAIAPAEAFAGIGHPAVVTVVAVLVISRALGNVGVVAFIAAPVTTIQRGGVMVQVLLFTALVAVMSAFMNNVGALALLLPVAIKCCHERDIPPSLLLMPMAFGSLLGGMLTAIGTPPNLIVAQYRAENGTEAFAMFDFLPVGIVLAVTGVAFLVLVGWRLLPRRDGSGAELDFTVGEYLAEVRIPAEHDWDGKPMRAVAEALGDNVALLAVLRDGRRLPVQHRHAPLAAGDILVVEAEAEALKDVVESARLELAGRSNGDDAPADDGDAEGNAEGQKRKRSDKDEGKGKGKGKGKSRSGAETDADVQLLEVVVLPDSRLVGLTASNLNLRWRFGLNLLAISRQGQKLKARLSRVPIAAGDVLLLEGERETVSESLSALDCLPLADRDLSIGQPRRVMQGLALFAGAIAVAAVGWVPIHVSFVGCALLMGGLGMISARESYRAIDWPIVLLLGAMIPVGRAMETSGGATVIAEALGNVAAQWPPIAGLAALLLLTMFLSDVINNAAAAVLMCPIAVGLAAQFGASTDAFLMAVAVGASCAFLTPVGHQSNTLVMGPGGYRFRDYWPLGLPLQLLIAVVAVFTIARVWPL